MGFIVMERIRGIQVENPYATSPLAPTSYSTAMRLLMGIRHYEGTDYYIQEVPEQEVNTMDEDTQARMQALADFLELELEDGETLEDYLSEDTYTENQFDYGNQSYLVLTEDEANAAAREYIENSLWAFNADFLAGNTGLPSEVFSALQDKAEDANETFLTLVNKCGDLDMLVRDANSEDGRGHFLAPYDFEESEQGDYFIYRVN